MYYDTLKEGHQDTDDGSADDEKFLCPITKACWGSSNFKTAHLGRLVKTQEGLVGVQSASTQIFPYRNEDGRRIVTLRFCLIAVRKQSACELLSISYINILQPDSKAPR